MEERDENKRRRRDHGGMERDAEGWSRSPVTPCLLTRIQRKFRPFLNGKKIESLENQQRKRVTFTWEKMISNVHMSFTMLMIVTLEMSPSSIYNQMAHFALWMSSFIFKSLPDKVFQYDRKCLSGVMYSAQLHAAFVKSWMEADSPLTELFVGHIDLQWSATMIPPWWDTTVPTGKKVTLKVTLVKVNSAHDECRIGLLDSKFNQL